MKALNKDTLREIKNSKGRFLSILLMIAIGVLVFIGLKITGPAMAGKADGFFRKTNGADIVVTSTYGLENEDINIIEKASDIKDIELGYVFDVLTTDKKELIRLNSETEKVNKLNIVKGETPKSDKEIVLDDKMSEKYNIGDKIAFEKESLKDEDNYSIKNHEFEIVGFAKSPDYVDAINLGNSNIGDGVITGIGFINKSVFELDNYSVAKITFNDLVGLNYSQSEYKVLAKEHKDEVDNLLETRKDKSFKDKKSEITKEINDGESKIADSKNKLKDAEKEIEDGKKKLADGYEKYDEGKLKLESETRKANEKLNNAQKEIDTNKKIIGAKKTVLDSSEKEIQKSKIQIDSGRKELDSAWKEYNSNKNLLEIAIGKYDTEINKMNKQLKEVNDTLAIIPTIPGQINNLQNEITNLQNQKQQKTVELNDKNNKLNQVNAQITLIENQLEQDPTNVALKNQLAQLKKEKDNTEKDINTLKLEISKIDSEISAKNKQIQELQRTLASEETLKENKKQLENGIAQAEAEKKEYQKKLNKLLSGETILDSKEKEWESGKQKYDNAVYALETGKKQISDGENKLLAAESKINEGRKQLELELEKGKKELSTALQELEKNKNILEDSENKFLEEKEKADEEIAKGEKNLEDARRILKVLEEPRYTVESRESSSQIYTFYDEAKRLGIISNIFPVFFFFIALLVSLTTMTRMVDENRLEIGTLKALGYSNAEIIKKYFIYGGIASVIGSILGILIGHKIISPLIFDAYAANYVFYSSDIPFNVFYSVISLIIGVLCTAVAGVVASRNSLKENASILMRGKPPKNGTRIFMERITFIWKKLSFMGKVTMRNLFRYKRRMFMTIIGISGCTGLIFMGFGIKDSITTLEQRQYHEIFNYDIVSIYNEDLSPEGYKEYTKIKDDESKVSKESPVVIENFKIEVKNAPEQDITLMSPKEEKGLGEFIKLRDRKTGSEIKLDNKGAVITEKAAIILNAKVGSEIEVKDANNKKTKVKVSGITENYSGHNIYMTQKYYEEAFSKEYEVNADVLKLKANDSKTKSNIIEEINNNESVVSIYNNNQVKDIIDTLLGTLNILVFVIIICSCTLAFVVLYNLTNINVSERLRELSTIKVLGFYDKEVTAYVYRETFILTFLGILLGYVIGFLMHYIIINNLVPDFVMLYPSLLFTNYILSGVITLAFAVVVMLVIHRKLRNINMVEALKAVE